MAQAKKNPIAMGTKMKTPLAVKAKIPAIKAPPIPTTTKTKTPTTNLELPQIKASPFGGPLPAKTPVDAASVVEVPEKSPYEKVKPPKERFDSWTDSSDMSLGQKWWSTKPKKQKRIALATILTFFTVVVVTVLVLIGIGVALLFREKRWTGDKRAPKEPVDKRLTTKTAYCRANRKLFFKEPVDPSCVYESKEEYNYCDEERFCDALKWGVRIDIQDKIPVLVFDVVHVDQSTDPPSDKAKFVECGYLQWCLNGTCVDSSVRPKNWWPNQDPFRDSDTSRPWVQRSLDTLPCLDKLDHPETTKSLANIEKWYGSCNHSVCSSRGVKHGIRVGWFHCNLDPDPITGAREDAAACDSIPMKIFACPPGCQKYAAIKAEDYAKQKCDPAPAKVEECTFACGERTTTGQTDSVIVHSFPDGFPCNAAPTDKDNKVRKGLCVMGKCLEIVDQSA